MLDFVIKTNAIWEMQGGSLLRSHSEGEESYGQYCLQHPHGRN